MDVKLAFLKVFLEEEVYAEQPTQDVSFKKKTLYKLKQTPRAVLSHIKDGAMIKIIADPTHVRELKFLQPSNVVQVSFSVK